MLQRFQLNLIGRNIFRLLAVTHALSACSSIVEENGHTPAGMARLTIAKLDNGKNSLTIRAVLVSPKSFGSNASIVITNPPKKALLKEFNYDDGPSWLGLRPGNYFLVAWCNREPEVEGLTEGYIDASPFVAISLKKNQQATLDCELTYEKSAEVGGPTVIDTNYVLIQTAR